MRILQKISTTGSVVYLALMLPETLRAFEPTLVTVLPRDTVQAYQRFGQQVAVDGALAAVGGPGESSDPGDPWSPAPGAVYIYRRSSEGWAQVQKLLPPVAEDGMLFGTGLSISGDTLVVGAPGAGAGRGSAYVYAWDGAQFSGGTELRPTSITGGDRFSDPVVVRGDWLAVGALGDSSDLDGSGAVYVYQRVGELWVSRGKVKAPVPQAWGAFGTGVDVEAGRLVVGAPYHAVIDPDSGLPRYAAGEVFVFQHQGELEWSEESTLHAGSVRSESYFGWSVSMQGAALAVGSPFSSLPGIPAGVVEVFEEASVGVWDRLPTLSPREPESYAGFGVGVKLRGDSLAVSMPGDGRVGDVALPGAGAVHVFARTLLGWELLAEWASSEPLAGENFGMGLDFDGHTLAVGAPGRSPSECGWDCYESGAAEMLEAGTVASPNQPPVADTSGTTLRVLAVDGGGGSVRLNGSASSDPDGDALGFRWLEGGTVLATESVATVRLEAGSHLLTLEVSDATHTVVADVTVQVLTPVGAVRELAAQLQASKLPKGRKIATLAVLRGVERALARGQIKTAVHQLTVFQALLAVGHSDRSITAPLQLEARWIQRSLAAR